LIIISFELLFQILTFCATRFLPSNLEAPEANVIFKLVVLPEIKAFDKLLKTNLKDMLSISKLKFPTVKESGSLKSSDKTVKLG